MSGTVQTFRRWMDEEKLGPALHALLYGLSLIYGAAVRARHLLYNSGILKTKRLPCKVISVGNITVGGSGKTPMTMHLAGILKKMGLRVVVLSRGYKRSGRGFAVVSDGEKTYLGPHEAGDEPYLMALRLKGIPVIVGGDRVKSGLHAVSKFSPHVIILDDGFQHIRLDRDLDIVLLDSKGGFGNSYLLPRGILREPVGALARADLVMVKAKGPPAQPPSEPIEKLFISEPIEEPFIQGLRRPVRKFSYRPRGVFDIKDNAGKEAGYLRGKKVIALSGIADPDSFLKTLEEAGAVIIKTITYPDHYWYTRPDIDGIVEQAKNEAVELVVTTEKDAVKLWPYQGALSGITILALPIEVVTEDLSELLGERLGTFGPK
jgi:tetraacyldisaccharide 4'-kinase